VLLSSCNFEADYNNSISGLHSWNGYHWARTSNPFTLNLRDNVSTTWDPYLNEASYDWSLSSVLDTTVMLFNGRSCRISAGSILICNSKYGKTGWLGIAQIWISGEHITQGIVKMNDTYFNMQQYNTPELRRLVMCQEIGHTLGLSHQDEDFYNIPLGSCMDYSSNPVLNQHPNFHDYEELELIYEHLDTTTTVISSTLDGNNWGNIVSSGEKSRIHILCEDRECLITHVFEVE